MAAGNLTEAFTKSSMTEEELRQTNQEIKKQFIVFMLCLFLTVTAFLAIATDVIPSSFGIPFILIMALIQLALQLLFFMHMKDKNHGWAIAFMITGLFITVPTITSLMLLIGVVKY